ncbi:MAG: lipid A biosynthesis lauroyl acyltransferase [Rhodospirillales bacterium]|nr:lipid A biosynthesis lauroyl acyltransferase [Rhodospirillales bacterium]
MAIRQSLTDRLLGRLVRFLLWLMARIPPDRAADLAAFFARTLGPLLPVQRIALANLRAAFPERDAAWHRAIAREAWDNLGRVAGEYVHLGRIWDYDEAHPNAGRIETADAAKLIALRDDGKPALCFAAHLGNWELPAVAAAMHGLDSAVVYRMPNIASIARAITRIRAPLMGRLIRSRPEAVFAMAGALESGAHLGMLIDQHFSRGVDIEFFGRRCKANPTLARLARQFDCPVVGVRVIRLPGRRFRIEATDPIDLPRDAAGRIDVAAATQAINTIVEGWVREHPGQWLWFHRRWR